MRLVGLDYDFRDIEFLRVILTKVVTDYSPPDLRAYISPSGRGYHVRFSIGLGFTDEDLLRIRAELHDDPNRISMVDNCYRDVLFNIKMVDGVIMREKEIDVNRIIEFGEEVVCG